MKTCPLKGIKILKGVLIINKKGVLIINKKSCHRKIINNIIKNLSQIKHSIINKKRCLLSSIIQSRFEIKTNNTNKIKTTLVKDVIMIKINISGKILKSKIRNNITI